MSFHAEVSVHISTFRCDILGWGTYSSEDLAFHLGCTQYSEAATVAGE